MLFCCTENGGEPIKDPSMLLQSYGRLGPIPRFINLAQPLDVGALHLRPVLHPQANRFARRAPRPPIALRLLDEGVHHLHVGAQPS